ncbi:uncharacterized protein LOC106011542 [Aplysia californica]|uniref:Uncharacterized protein LOC106011542 n=1 Tax=Aplysia californica TaxID=6500 RepID=A0ABM0ZYC1_APLCA|nr:uncharacterized protein LOC106011542 [Aplysia californica]
MVMDIQANRGLFEVDPGIGGDEGNDQWTAILYTSLSNAQPVGVHKHAIVITSAEWEGLQAGDVLHRETDNVNNHFHTITYSYDSATQQLLMQSCDNQDTCFDGHSMVLTMQDAFRVELGLPDTLG